MIKKVVSILVVIATIVAIVACSSSDDSTGSGITSDSFDRQTMLVNWADNVIIPIYQDLNSELQELIVSKDEFIANPDQTNLDAIRSSWLNAYKVWQYAEMFNIGRAESINYFAQMNIYPTSVTEIESNISAGSYDLNHPNNQDAVGFPALDYMLYGVANGESDIIDVYTINANAEEYKNYLSDLVDQMSSLTTSVLNDWTTVYRDQFINSTANTATSSTNKFTNDFMFYYEKGLRANKIGIPAGVFSTDPLPSKVEAYFRTDVSRELTLAALNAVQDFFNGKAYGNSSTDSSFKQYLQYLNTMKNGEDLDVLINNQLNAARTAILDINANYVEQINLDINKMTMAYDELQKAVVLLKVDMIQAMNISVDFVDADGD